MIEGRDREAERRAATLVQNYGPEATHNDRVQYLTQQLLESELVDQWKRVVQLELAKPEYSVDDMQRVHSTIERTPMYRAVDKLGLMASLKRMIIDLHGESQRATAGVAQRQAEQEETTLIPPDHSNGLDVVAKARGYWEKITRDELLRFTNEQGKPLVATAQPSIRPVVDGKPIDADDDIKALTAISELAKLFKPPPSTRFLYDSQDLLHSLQAIKPVNCTASAAPGTIESWTTIQLQFHSPSTSELRRIFAELGPSHGQIGVDELFPMERNPFLAEKNRVGDLVLSHHSVSMARQYAKTGCPSNLRGSVWRQALSLRPVNADTRHQFQQLQDLVTRWTFVTDDMYLLDLQRAIDSSDYFVFQDLLISVMMAFTRDASVFERAPQVNGAVPLTDATVPASTIPPNGILPFSGLVMYLAPLLYVYVDEVELYIVFREMYIRYWSRLNAIRSDASTILPLCRLFEDLVIRSSTAAVHHLLDIGLRPLDIAFPWIQSAFSGVLELKQILLLWDRVVGYDSLELLAVAAAALFHFRVDALATVGCKEDVSALYAELLDVHIVPLLQEYLFLLA